MRVIYHHNHIPRTAGTFIHSPITSLLNSRGINYSLVFQKNKIDDDKIKKSKYIFGHIGCYPETILEDVCSFSVVRDPFQRFISTFNFFSEHVFYTKPTMELLEKWVYDPVFSENHRNIQSKFLTGSSNKDRWNAATRPEIVANGWMIENYESDIKKITDKIDMMKVVSLENIDSLLDWLSDISRRDYGFPLFNQRHPINESSGLDFEIPESIKSRIEELNSIDYHLYDYVKTNEHKSLNGV